MLLEQTPQMSQQRERLGKLRVEAAKVEAAPPRLSLGHRPRRSGGGGGGGAWEEEPEVLIPGDGAAARAPAWLRAGFTHADSTVPSGQSSCLWGGGLLSPVRVFCNFRGGGLRTALWTTGQVCPLNTCHGSRAGTAFRSFLGDISSNESDRVPLASFIFSPVEFS